MEKGHKLCDYRVSQSHIIVRTYLFNKRIVAILLDI